MISRHEIIIELLKEFGEISLESLVKTFNVSASTARRDILTLCNHQWYEKTKDGIKLASLVEDKHIAVYKMDIDELEVMAIANKAASMVYKGDVIAISGGRICHQFALRLRDKIGITVVTNALNIAIELTAISGIQVLVTGGVLNNDSYELVGQSLGKSIDNVIIKNFFLGTHGIFVEHGITAHDEAEAQATRDIRERSENAIVLADSSKFTPPSFSKALPISLINKLITTDNVSEVVLNDFRDVGIDVIVAKTQTNIQQIR